METPKSFYDDALDLAFETGWLRGSVEAVIGALENEKYPVDLRAKVAISGLRDILDNERFATALRRNKALRNPAGSA